MSHDQLQTAAILADYILPATLHGALGQFARGSGLRQRMGQRALSRTNSRTGRSSSTA